MMKKRLLFVFCLLLLCAVMLCACDESASSGTQGDIGGGTNTEEGTGDDEDEPSHTHVYGAWSTTTAPTCTVAGVKTRTCSCGASETEAVAAAGHSKTHHAAVAVECLTAGNIEYWSCSNCGKYFSDAACTIKIANKNSVVISATGHQSVTHHAAVAASYTTAGNIEHWECTDCDTYFSNENCTVAITDKNTVVLSALIHTGSIIHHAAVEPGCLTAGNIEYWSCDCCDKYFSNAGATDVISDKTSVVISATGHQSVTHHEATEASCTATGNIEYWECTTCDKYFSNAACTTEITDKTSVVIAATGHQTVTHHEATEASCTVIGNTEYWECTDCDTYFSDEDCTTEITDKTSVVITALHPDAVVHYAAVSATCTTGGNTEYWECTTCDKYFSNAACTTEITDKTSVVISATGHQTVTHHEMTEASCTATGNTEYWECTDCDTYFSDEDCTTEITDKTSVVISATGIHIYNTDNVCTICQTPLLYTEGLAYILNSDEISYSVAKGTATATDIVIPPYHEGKPVTSIGSDAFYNCSNLTSITIPSSVTSIGSSAFYYCSNLRSITFGANSQLTSIGDDVFRGCSSLTSITIPSSVKSIGSTAFAWCRSLTSITIPSSVTSIGSNAFIDCCKLIEVYDLSPTLTITAGSDANGRVGYYAKVVHTDATAQSRLFTDENGYIFYDDGTNCYLMGYTGNDTALTLPADCKGKAYSIYEYAFYYRDDIVSVSFAANAKCTGIGESAFRYCSRLTSITIPAGVTSIGEYAFYYCSSLESITVENGNTVYHSAGNCLIETASRTLIIGCKNSVIPADGSVTSIGSSAFYYCSNLTSITIPSSVTSIGSSAFYYCSSLTSITIPASVKSIGDDAFRGCSSLTSITIPASVKGIGDYAFYGCCKLIEVYDLSTSLTITAGSSANGYVGYYAKVIHTAATAQSRLFTDENGYIFYDDGTNRYLMGYTGNDTALTLPADCKGKAYSIYQYAFYRRYDIVSVSFAANAKCTGIGEYAFGDCDSLTSITIPSSVTSIGDWAFDSCSNLESITLPFVGATLGGTSNTHFGYIFGASSYSSNSSYVPESLKTVVITGGMSIGDYAFYNCSSLTSITIPSSVTSIGNYAFSGCSSLMFITIPSGVTSIGDSAFSGCSGLESITVASGNTVYHSAGNCLIETASRTLITGCKNSVIPADGSVTSIGSYAFYSCDSLTSITIPAGVTSIGDYAFGLCDSLMSITIPSGVTSIGDDAFRGCSSLTSITIPASVTSIGSYAFYECYKLIEVYNLSPSLTITAGSSANGWVGNYAKVVYTDATAQSRLFTDENGYIFYDDGTNRYLMGYTGNDTALTLPADCKGKAYSIYQYAFYRCYDIVSVSFAANAKCTGIGNYAFRYCSSLRSITIPSSVMSIGYEAFSGCSSLMSITIPSSVTSIGNYAFRYCSSLRSITIPSSVTSIGDYAFCGCSSLMSITIPSSVTSIGSRAFYSCSNLTSITIPSGVTSIGDSAFESCSSLTSITFAANSQLTSIGESAFYSCDSLTSITIPAGVTSIGYYAFYECSSLTSITIPSGVTSIGESAFRYCSRLTSITIPSSVTSIGYEAFKYCYSLTTVTFDANSQLTRIASDAFKDCDSLTSITIPASVTSIGAMAFYGCSSLTMVTFKNTSGWKVSTSSTFSSSTSVSVSNESTAATYLKSTYLNYFWKRG